MSNGCYMVKHSVKKRIGNKKTITKFPSLSNALCSGRYNIKTGNSVWNDIF